MSPMPGASYTAVCERYNVHTALTHKHLLRCEGTDTHRGERKAPERKEARTRTNLGPAVRTTRSCRLSMILLPPLGCGVPGNGRPGWSSLLIGTAVVRLNNGRVTTTLRGLMEGLLLGADRDDTSVRRHASIWAKSHRLYADTIEDRLLATKGGRVRSELLFPLLDVRRSLRDA